MTANDDSGQQGPGDLTADAVHRLLPGVPGGLVMFDIDCTLSNGLYSTWSNFEARPGVADLLTALLDEGWRVGLWTGGGAQHAQDVAEWFGLTDRLHVAMDKPPYPMTAEAVVGATGEMPVLTVDDDASEAVPGVTFLHVAEFWGSRLTV